MSVTRDDIVEVARSLIGCRFKKYGRHPREGFDCVGVLVWVGQTLGVRCEDLQGYVFNPTPQIFMDHICNQTDPVPLRPQHGSIALLRQSVYPMHTGIFAKTPEGYTVINANMKKRGVVEEPISAWDGLILKVRDYQGIT